MTATGQTHFVSSHCIWTGCELQGPGYQKLELIPEQDTWEREISPSHPGSHRQALFIEDEGAYNTVKQTCMQTHSQLAILIQGLEMKARPDLKQIMVSASRDRVLEPLGSHL